MNNQLKFDINLSSNSKLLVFVILSIILTISFLGKSAAVTEVSVAERERHEIINIRNNLPVRQKMNVSVRVNDTHDLSAWILKGNVWRKSFQTDYIYPGENWTSEISFQPGTCIQPDGCAVNVIFSAEYTEFAGETLKEMEVNVKPVMNNTGIASAKDISWKEFALLGVLGSLSFVVLSREKG